MKYVRYVLVITVTLSGTAWAQTPPPSSAQQKPPDAKTQKAGAQQVTLTGCLRQVSDDPKMFALVDAKPMTGSAQSKTGEDKNMSGGAAASTRAPFYRLQQGGTSDLKMHVDKRVEVTGTVTPAKDEKGADIVTYTKEQTARMTTTTIRAVDLKPAPLLNVQSVKATGDCPAGK